MDRLPPEVIGNVLSRLGGARNAVVASAACRKWRQAYRKHLHTLSFDINDWHAYRDLTTGQLEILITQTVLQTTGLQVLCIFLDVGREFFAATVIAWLLYTRETLRGIKCNVRTDVNILEIFGRQKLESLELSHNLIAGVEPNYQRFPCLKSLSLGHVTMSAVDLSLLLSACPRLEKLELKLIVMSDVHAGIELSSPTLKCFCMESISWVKLLLEADSIEYLHMKDCALELFELFGKGTLKHLKIDDVTITHFDIGVALDYLEVVDVGNCTIIRPQKFFQIISRSSRLRKLRLWDVVCDGDEEIVNLENSAVCFPRLNHLALTYDLRDGEFEYGLQGSTYLMNLTVLELGSNVINNCLSNMVDGLLKHCPNLKKLIIHGIVSRVFTREESQMLADFTSAMVQLMRKYIHVDVRFDYG